MSARLLQRPILIALPLFFTSIINIPALCPSIATDRMRTDGTRRPAGRGSVAVECCLLPSFESRHRKGQRTMETSISNDIKALARSSQSWVSQSHSVPLKGNIYGGSFL